MEIRTRPYPTPPDNGKKALTWDRFAKTLLMGKYTIPRSASSSWTLESRTEMWMSVFLQSRMKRSQPALKKGCEFLGFVLVRKTFP